MTFGELMRDWKVWAATALAIALGTGAGRLLGDSASEHTFALVIPLVAVLLLLPLATVIEFHWQALPTAILVLALHALCWLLLTAGFFGWTDAQWLDGQGFSSGSPSGLSLAFAIFCCVIALPLGVSTLLAPALTLAAGIRQPVAAIGRLLNVPGRAAGGIVLTLAAVLGGAVVATYVAIFIAFAGGGPAGLFIVPVIALAGSVAFAAVTATNVVWLAEIQTPQRPPLVRVALACAALLAASLGLATGESLDYTDVSGPLTAVEQDSMTRFAPSNAQLHNEIRTKRGRGGAPQIDRAGTMYERSPMVLRSFLLQGDARTAADEAAAAATAAGWVVTEQPDLYSSSVTYTGTRSQDGTELELSISGTPKSRCPAHFDNPSCKGAGLRVEVSSEWELEPEARELAEEPMAEYVPPGTSAGQSQTYGATSISRDFYVLKPAGKQKVIDAAAAAANAAQAAGWQQSVTGENLWVGEKRDGSQLLRLRIDTDLLPGARGTYVDDKEGFVKILIVKVDR